MAKPEQQKKAESPAAPSGVAEAPAAPAVAVAPPPPAVRYHVHEHGALHYNGAVYLAGAELAIDEAEYAAMACLAVIRSEV